MLLTQFHILCFFVNTGILDLFLVMLNDFTATLLTDIPGIFLLYHYFPLYDEVWLSIRIHFMALSTLIILFTIIMNVLIIPTISYFRMIPKCNIISRTLRNVIFSSTRMVLNPEERGSMFLRDIGTQLSG